MRDEAVELGGLTQYNVDGHEVLSSCGKSWEVSLVFRYSIFTLYLMIVLVTRET